MQAFSDALHGHGATVSVQMVHQGGMPHGASAVMSAPVINLMPHVMDQDDIDAFVREYAASARLSLEGRADGVEVHLNHDDIHEWFLSPFTNQRTDRYGGSLENRARFAVETHAGDPRRGRLGDDASASGSTSARRCPGATTSPAASRSRSTSSPPA